MGKKVKIRRFYRVFRLFSAIFWVFRVPLTPSFVADAREQSAALPRVPACGKRQIAPAANNRYSVPCESSYPSHRYHISYKIEQIKYNIWFLFYMAIFNLPQFGERNGETFRIEFCFSPRFSACFARGSGLFCFILLFQKIGLGKVLSVDDLLSFFELKFLRVVRVHRGGDRAAQTVPRPDVHDLAQNA